MGFLKKILSNLANSDDEFINLVKANENGEAWAKQEISRLYNSGDQTFLPRYHRACAVIYKEGAMNGDRTAILKYARGLAWSGNENESVAWYRKLTDYGDTDAMLELAFEYCEFGGLPTNPQAENFWIRKAAETGNAEAQYKLGLKCLCDGNRQESAMWYKKSAEQGNPDGKAGYAKVLTDKLYEHLMQFKKNNISIQEKESLAEEIVNLNAIIEDLLIDALNDSELESTVQTAYTDLAMLYLRDISPIISPHPYRAAFFDYMAYYYFELEFSFKRMKETIQKYNLQVNNATLQEWQTLTIDEWASKYGIEI